MPFHRELREIWVLAYVIFCMKAYQNPWCISIAGVIGNSIFLSLPYSLAFDYSLVLHNILSLEFLHLMNSQSILSFYSILAHFIPFIKFLFIEQVLSCSKSYFFYQTVNSLKSGTISYSLLYLLDLTQNILHTKVVICYMNK